jgi:hypothetical protein
VIEPLPSLEEQAQQFADELSALLTAVFPGAPGVAAQISGDRVVVAPVEDVALLVEGNRLATLEIHVRCRLDSRGRWLAVDQSAYKLRLDADSTPLLRLEYMRDAHTAPSAHLQVHAQRGALSHLLSRAGHHAPHDMSKLHLPLGGARFRPCLEDLVQLLVSEFGLDALPAWEQAVFQGRARWRRTQAKAVTRDFPDEAVDVLRQLGYQVEAPSEPAATGEKALMAW